MRLPLPPRKFQGRLLLTYLILTSLGLGGLILWTGLRLQATVLHRAERDLEIQALLMANALYEPLEKWREGKGFRRPSLDGLVHSYAHSAGGRVTIFSPSGQILMSSDAAGISHVEEDAPEIVAALRGRSHGDVRQDAWGQQERLFVAAPIRQEEGEYEGVVQLSIPTAQLYGEMRRTWVNLMTAGGVVLVVTILVSLALARQVTRPIRSLTTVTQAMANGQLDQRVTVAGPEEIKHLGHTFNRMAQSVQEVLARQQAFVADAAHELRSPLASLALRIELLHRHGSEATAFTPHYLSQMAQDVERLRRLVDHLLALARLDEGVALVRSPLDLAPVLYEIADEMTPQAQAAGVHLQMDVPPHLPAVMANAEAMRIMVRNLLDNALQYTPPGGLVTLEATAEKQQPSTPGGARLHANQPSEVIIQVRDTGIGIPADHLPHIFERFYRVDQARSRRQGGAGLGLALVRSIVEAHGGWIGVKSKVSQGTTFTICLPLSPVP
ncbi:MAG TPA: ATP-binding protein [Alphaproteobacteria bacterium]|nr:ATP-binding protein [Alphaproteobacteria bacterium]